MSNKWIKILLVASLAINSAFAGTYVLRKINPPQRRKQLRKSPVGKKIDKNINKKLKKGMNLSKRQREEVFKIIKQFKMEMLGYKQEILNQRIDIIESLNDPQLSKEDISKKTSQLNELENQLNLSFVETLVKINDLLDSRQRLDFLLKLSKDWFFIHDRRDRGHRYSSGGKRE